MEDDIDRIISLAKIIVTEVSLWPKMILTDISLLLKKLLTDMSP